MYNSYNIFNQHITIHAMLQRTLQQQTNTNNWLPDWVINKQIKLVLKENELHMIIRTKIINLFFCNQIHQNSNRD